jgi:hypothetical protein
MPDARDRLSQLEKEVKESAASERSALEKEVQKHHAKRPIRRKTKQKILVGLALVLTFLLVWKKVNIHFVVFTSFWGFLGIVLGVFAIVYFVLRFFFEENE